MGGAAVVRRHPVRVAVALSALLSLIYLLWQPPTLDLAAQTFRAELWASDGWVLWNEAWYGGHTVPGYSLLFPPLGALLGPALLGAVCAVAAAALFGAIASRALGERAALGILWFGAASTVALYGGRTTFALGLALGLAALLALQRGRPALAALAALLTGLASPVAGLFLGLAAAAVLLAWRYPRPLRRGAAVAGSPARGALAILLAAGSGVAALALAFPTEGHQPFAFSSFVWIPLVCAATVVLAGAKHPVLLWAALLYAAVGVAAFAIESPLGGNAVRLGTTFAGPVLALLLVGRRPALLMVVALPLLWWQWTATVRDVASGVGDPSTGAGYFDPAIDAIVAHSGGDRPLRVHVTPTRNRWESVHVADRFPIARGWLRQIEAEDFDQFGGGGLSAVGYQQWLYEHGVAYVALPDAELDYLGVDEAELLRSRNLPFLRPILAEGSWRVWEVRSADGTRPPRGASLASGGARLTELAADGFSVRVPGPGDHLIRVRWSPYLQVAAGGPACVEDGGGSSTRLEVRGRGARVIEVRARLGAEGLLRRPRSCSP